MTGLLWALACAPAPGEPTRASMAAPAPADPEPRGAYPEAQRRSALPPAPTRRAFGLELGASDHDAIEAWTTRHGVVCSQYPSPTRATFHYRCAGVTAAEAPPGELLLVRAEGAALHFIAFTRAHVDAASAAADYARSVAALQSELGPPVRQDAFGTLEDVASARIVRYVTTFSFRDLDVSVKTIRVAGGAYSVEQSWQVPGVEASVPTHARQGALSGQPGARPPGWNPHVSDPPPGR